MRRHAALVGLSPQTHFPLSSASLGRVLELTRKLLDSVKERDLYFEFDYADIPAMQQDQKAQADTAAVYFGMGCSPENIFKFLNIDIDLTPGQELGRYPFNLTVAGEEKDLEETSAETDDMDGEENQGAPAPKGTAPKPG
jgi:hypothetical protein